MMNSYMQIGLGLIPGVVFMIIFLVKRKAFHFRKILLTLLVAAACGGMLTLGVQNSLEKGLFTRRVASEKNMLALAAELYTLGEYDSAEEVLGEYCTQYGYDEKYRLLKARVYLAKEQYDKADGLYRYLTTHSKLVSADSQEVLFAAGKVQQGASDLVVLSYLESLGLDPAEYGFSTSSSELKKEINTSNETILQDICEDLAATYKLKNQGILACAEFLEEANKNTASNGSNRETAQQLVDALQSVEDNCPELLTIDSVRKAKLSALVLSGSFQEITRNLDKNATYHELLLASELYIGGYVDDSDFPDSFRHLNATDTRAVRNQLNEVRRQNREGLTVQESNALRNRVLSLKKQLDSPVLVTLKSKLQEEVDTAGKDSSKVQLGLAKIENYFGNEEMSDTYLSKAIYSAQNCSDDSYAYAMNQIMQVMEDGGERTESIKEVPEYVQIVENNALTMDVEEALASGSLSQKQKTQPIESPVGGLLQDVVQVVPQNTVQPRAFSQNMTDYVSRMKSAITIGHIDKEQFPKISAKVQISSKAVTDTTAIKKALKVTDCGDKINPFELEKVVYNGSNILLCCDVSGSMAGSIGDLREAVRIFHEDKNADEMLSVVTFNESIVETVPFGEPDIRLTALVDNMWANGGTDMFSAVLNCLGTFPNDKDKNNILILMTDGQDNTLHSAEEIQSSIGSLANYKDVTIYTIGLGGSVDTNYLTTIAESGNGSFVYVSESSSLKAFYNMLHEQVHNQYVLTYEATDTLTQTDRPLEVSLPDEKLRTTKMYDLVDNTQGTANGNAVTLGLAVEGISPRYLYKGLQDVAVELKGQCFNKDLPISVKLKGNINYDIPVKFVDSTTYSLTIPASTAVGTYDVEIVLEGKKTVLHKGFSILTPGDEKETKFGKYIFTSAEKIQNADGSCILRGGVKMNGWLRFKGDVVLSGNLDNGGSIQVEDNEGSYVEFDQATALGAGKLLAKQGISLDVPALYKFRLYYDETVVDDIQTGLLSVYKVVRFDSPCIRLYPDNIQLNYKTGTTALPYQDSILKKIGSDKLFEFSFDGTAEITDKNLGIILDCSLGDADSSNYNRKVNLFNAPVFFNGSVHVKIDTLKNEYMAGAMVHTAFLAQGSGFGAEIEWKGFTVDSVKLKTELAHGIKLPTTIPITIDGFGFKVSDIKTALDSNDFRYVVLTGSMSLSSGKLSDFGLSALKKYLGDIKLLSMPDTSASFRLKPFRIEADAKLVFLSEITLAEAGLKLGGFEYSNTMLDLKAEEVQGVSAKLKQGIIWNTADNRVKLELSGTGEIDAHSRFVGIALNGTGIIDVKWWLFNFESKKAGDVCFGMYTTHDGKQEFVLVTKYVDGKKVKGSFYYIDENGNSGKNKGYLN